MIKHKNLVAYYPMEGNANDASGNGRNFAVTGATLTPGQRGQGYEYAVNTDKLEAAAFNITPIYLTLAFNIYPTQEVDYNLIVSVQWRQFFFHSSATGIYCGTHDGNRFAPADLPTGTLNLNTWQFITYVNDNGTGYFYKNGTLLASKAQTASDLWTDNLIIDLVFGATSGAGSKIDNVMIFSKALSQNDIRRLMLGLHPLG